MEENRRRWKADHQHSWMIVPWNRSQTALWLGERGGMRTWLSPSRRQVGLEAGSDRLGAVVAQDPSRRRRCAGSCEGRGRLETRQSLDRVLVLCPKALTIKWRQEMRRFDEDFRILSAASLRYCLDEAHAEGEWPIEYARSIVHYELLRMEPYLVGDATSPGLLELDPPPRFDLVIADEAHHLRTPGTGSHRLIQHLSEVTEALVLMTATPVQIHADDLFVLLNVLRPDLFPDKSVFAEIVEPNRHITRAMRLLRSGPSSGADWQREAGDALRAAAETS